MEKKGYEHLGGAESPSTKKESSNLSSKPKLLPFMLWQTGSRIAKVGCKRKSAALQKAGENLMLSSLLAFRTAYNTVNG